MAFIGSFKTLLTRVVLTCSCFTWMCSATTVNSDSLKFEPEIYSLPRLEPWAKLDAFGPKYPVTAAWFRDRYSPEEWDKTLGEFLDVGGDTVILRAPGIALQTRDDFLADPNYQWCRAQKPFGDVSCYDDAMQELSALGLNVTAVGKYDYEEDYSEEAMIECPKYEKRYSTSRVYYRLVFSMEPKSTTDPCDLKGSRVMVLFTSFSGIDAHQLLLQSAHAHNMTVYFGLPQLPMTYGSEPPKYDFRFSIPFLDLMRRILRDHQHRFALKRDKHSLYETLKGYFYSSDVILNSDVIFNSTSLNHFSNIGESIHSVGKLFAMSTYYNANKLLKAAPLDDYIRGFQILAQTKKVDVISVRDGRGYGNGAYYWSTQLKSEILKTDPSLYKILQNYAPNVAENVTFEMVYEFSIQQLFYNLAATRDAIAGQSDVDLWLNIEAFDFLHDDPCLPVDKSGSGLGEVTDRVTKSRLDRVLTHAGTYVSKVTSYAWDPSFTCTTSYNGTLAGRVKADYGRPIIANCSFHSAFNRSVVVIGYNLLAETQSFSVSWPTVDGKRQTNNQVYGYYFEIDWGIQHGRVPSLMYTQLFDPYDVIQLAPKGWVHVSVGGGYNSCFFTYDFTREPVTENDVTHLRKKHYLSVDYPRWTVYGQNVPFPFQHRLFNRKRKL